MKNNSRKIIIWKRSTSSITLACSSGINKNFNSANFPCFNRHYITHLAADTPFKDWFMTMTSCISSRKNLKGTSKEKYSSSFTVFCRSKHKNLKYSTKNIRFTPLKLYGALLLLIKQSFTKMSGLPRSLKIKGLLLNLQKLLEIDLSNYLSS